MTPSPRRKGPRPARWIDRLDEVEEKGDRRATIPLVEAFTGAGAGGEIDDDLAADVADALASLEDVRAAGPLLAFALDASQPTYRRALAVQSLGAIPANDPPRDQILEWGRSDDPILRALGTMYLEVADSPRLAAAVSDSDVFVRRTAAEALGMTVRTPLLIEALRRSLRDEDAVVREIACRVALFDEPVEASWDLLRALDDPSIQVRTAAAEALQWYPRVPTLLALAEARAAAGDATKPGQSGADRDYSRALFAATIDLTIRSLVDRYEEARAAASPAVRTRIERWLEPAAWVVEQEHERRRRESAAASGAASETSAKQPSGSRSGDAPNRESSNRGSESSSFAVPSAAPRRVRRAAATRTGPAPRPVVLSEAKRVLEDPDSSSEAVREQLVRRDWRKVGVRGKELLRACAKSPSWAVRQLSARPLAELGMKAELGQLGWDSESVVRRAAFWSALDAGAQKNSQLLVAAMLTLDDPYRRPIAGDPALAVVIALGRDDVSDRCLLRALAAPDDRDGNLLGAISIARIAGLDVAIPHLVGIAERPVTGHVRPQLAALAALRSLCHPRSKVNLRKLVGIDHIDVVAELAEWGHTGARR